ncbi:MAG: glutaminyl-peptide cyclotransferase [Nanoarchaeota archaeon]
MTRYRLVAMVIVILITVLGGVVVWQFVNQPPPEICSTRAHPSSITRLLPASADPASCTYSIVQTYSHDSDAFTQGLVYENGGFYEGTGLYGYSSLRRVELETGQVLQQHNLPSEYFGEGITVLDNRIYQLTWQSRVGFVYDQETFELLKTFRYPTEGWGITHDGKRLIMSDGTNVLHFLDPDTLTEMGSIDVRDKNIPVERLNELEYINGFVYANIWLTDRIAKIDPTTGKVVAWIDLSDLFKHADYAGVDCYRSVPCDVLNGIAYDAQNDRLFVTGKRWHKLFEITLRPSDDSTRQEV